MNRWKRFSGVLGAVFLLFGIVGGFMVGFRFSEPVQQLVMLQIFLGVALIVAWFVIVGISSVGETSQALRGRTVRFGANALLYAAVFISLLSALNWLVSRHDVRWDLTEQNVYSLAPVSQKIIEGLKKPLKIVFFKGVGSEDEATALDLLNFIQSANKSKVTLELVDPRGKPHLVEKYEMKQGNLVYLEYGEDGGKKGVSRLNEASEQVLINGVLKLTRGDAKKLYYVTGHNEPDLASEQPDGAKQLIDALVDEHLSVEPIVLGEKQSVPEDAAAVLLIAPRSSLLPQEREMLTQYVDKGGRLLMMADPRLSADVRSLSAYFGIKVGNDIIVDLVNRLFAGPALGVQPVVSLNGTHAINSAFTERHHGVFNQSSSVTIVGEKSEGVSYDEIAKTGPQSWAETNLAGIFDSAQPNADKDGDDTAGPITVGVAYEKKITNSAEPKDEGSSDRAGRVVVFGDSDWVLNANLSIYSHRDLILSVLNWLAGEDGGVTIGQRSFRTPELSPISQGAFEGMLAASLLIPELIFVFGLVIWWRRRTVVA